MGAGLLEDDEYSDCLERHPWVGWIPPALVVLFASLFLFFTCWAFLYGYVTPEFWVKVPGIEGLDRNPGAATTPTFNITLRVNNEGTRRQFCGKGGSVVVAYAGVQLAHADLPEFCVPGRVVGSVPVLATSDGLGMPDELYRLMESQRQRHERVQLEVQVRLDEAGSLPVMLWCTAVLHGQPKGPFLCTITYMLKDGRIYD